MYTLRPWPGLSRSVFLVLVPFGVYTSDADEWSEFQSDYCDPRVLSLSRVNPNGCEIVTDTRIAVTLVDLVIK